jgi:N-acetylneuraminic acid mutarotase
MALASVLAFGCSSNPSSNQHADLNQQNPNDPGTQPGDPNDDPSSEEGGGGDPNGGGTQRDCVFNGAGSERTASSGWMSVAGMESIGLPAGSVLMNSVWTGHELVGWGARNDTNVTAGAFSYNPKTDTWKALPDPMLAHQTNGYIDVITMAGRNRVAFWGGRSYDPDGAIFDLCKGTWTKIPRAPVVGRNVTAYGYIANTDELVIWGGVRSSTGAGFPEENKGPIGAIKDGAAYNLHTHTWRVISNPTWKADEPQWWLGYWSTTTDGKMVIYGGGPSHGGGPTVGEAFAYDAASDTWTELATPAIQGRMQDGQAAVKTGGETLIFGGDAIHMPKATPGDGAILDLATLTWTAIPAPTADVMPAPERAWQASWMIDGKVYAWGGASAGVEDPTGGGSGAVFDRATKTWSAMPAGGPTGLQQAVLLDGEAFVWSSTQMMLFKP